MGFYCSLGPRSIAMTLACQRVPASQGFVVRTSRDFCLRGGLPTGGLSCILKCIPPARLRLRTLRVARPLASLARCAHLPTPRPFARSPLPIWATPHGATPASRATDNANTMLLISPMYDSAGACRLHCSRTNNRNEWALNTIDLQGQ